MIRTVADLLNAMRERQLQAIRRAPPVGHPVMIGDMYEGLTRHLLGRALFPDLDLRVVEGKIRDSKGALTNQIDCMVVVGDGERLPFTTHYVYDVKQVIAVVEVKKSLYRGELGEAYANLLTVAGRMDPREIPSRRVLNPFRGITGIGIEGPEDLNRLPLTSQFVFHTLVGEALLPIRIALGYSGYASEYTLRQGFWQYLESRLAASQQLPLRGHGPSNLPNLIVAGSNALVKLNAMPYALRQDSERWLLYGSVGSHSTPVLLEVLWSRLASRFDLDPQIFGEDLEMEQVNPLIEGYVEETAGRRGWHYTLIEIPAKNLKQRPPTVPWQPAIVDETQFVVLNILCKREEIDIDHDEDFRGYLRKRGMTIEEFIDHMTTTGLVYLTHDRRLRLLTTECLCAIDPELGYVVAENHDGRFERWLGHRAARRGSTP